ncbi:hypothetical protein Patl1_16949 [Pistacia atlantica]|uniref:Uncharacterized protein n=1 Tax=Pistacia atlantica TaxID=434234 RepID=A0ACC1B7C0_9ROSI|nr:hypothetical protein Patl1_16949 [Pistacia atlantica]
MAQPSSDRLSSTGMATDSVLDSAEALKFLILDNEEKIINPNMLNSQDVVPIGSQRDIVDQSLALGSVGYQKDRICIQCLFLSATIIVQWKLVFYISLEGSDNAAGKQGTYLPYINHEVLENGSHIKGIHNESPSVAYHGYGYSPQMLHKPYVPITRQLSARNHGHLYNARQFSTSDPFSFRQNISPNSYILSPTPGFSSKVTSYPLISKGIAKDLGFEGPEVGGLWSDWLNPSDGKSCVLPLSSPTTSLKQIGSLELSQDDFGLDFTHATFDLHRLLYRKDHFMALDLVQAPATQVALTIKVIDPLIMEVSPLLPWEWTVKAGPHSLKQDKEEDAMTSHNSIIDDLLRDSYNRLDFITSYKDAKFFIIKSYSEDNVHKSIKYGVWASTPNGNKKLDCAYREAKEKERMCPIFLLFSVNASAQFCGVAEMVGPVDFDKNVDYWLQDKWSGQFPVKWHIIKDVPNSQFRHILLENNDNKPVTNSRDTQEVEMEQGMEMLNIFKNYETYSSILDDFYFYEKRQKAIQERKAGEQASLVAPPVVVVSEQQIPISPSPDSVKRMSKSFAEAVSLTEHEKERLTVGKVVSSTTTSVPHGS